ncbi:MAG: AMP-binding protein [Serratia marcescens]|nr:AMP-binding protein [Serratia marcescens]
MNSDVKADTSSWVDRCREHVDVLSWSLSDGRSETETVLGSAAAERGARIAHWLTQHTEPGDRIILALPDGPNLVVGMLACSHANVVSVPLKTDDIDRGEQLSPFVVYVLGHAAPTAVLTDSAHLDIFAANAGEHDYVAVAIADLLDEPELDAALPRDPDQTAMMLYSSGSTGTPKGVPVEPDE